MKIVCEACQAKYSIADEKVRGKVFKIRCKKCSHVIVVRGTSDAGGEAVTPAVSLDAVTEGWHIVVDGEQVGPLSVTDLRGRLSRGEITAETYVWKEGLADWAKLGTIAEFADAAETGTPFEGGAEADPFAGAETAVSAPGAMAGLAAAGAAASAGPSAGDLFAAPSSVPSASSPRVGFDPPAAADPFLGASSNGAGGGLTAQRHENSVLFSLANLEALAKPSMPAPSSPAGGAGYAATTEGSGLIDIRAMANMTLGAVSSKDESAADDLPAFSAPQFSPVAPVLLPLGASGTPRWAIAVLGGLMVAILSLTILLIVVWTRDPEPAVVQAPPVESAEAPVAAAPPGPPKAETPPPTPPPAEDEALPPREGPPKPAATAASDEDEKKSRRDRRRRPRSEGPADDPVIAVSPRNRAAPAPEAPRKPKDDIEALLEAAAGGSPRRSSAPRQAAAPSASDEKLPPLSRGQVVKGMNAVLPKAKACYKRYNVPGTAMAKITVEPTGRVSKASVSGKFAGTPSGDCVEAALMSAHFDRSGGLTFDYPVALR